LQVVDHRAFVNPQYKYADNQPPTITDYQASNQVKGPSFEIDEPEAVYDGARRATLDKAQKRAEMYAKSLDMKVKRIVSVSVSEGGGFQPPQPMMMMAKAEGYARDQSSPVSPGETTLTANLDVVFELGR
jgi:uncharacterized protein YggE